MLQNFSARDDFHLKTILFNQIKQISSSKVYLDDYLRFWLRLFYSEMKKSKAKDDLKHVSVSPIIINVCRGCHRVFKSRPKLLTHQSSCMRYEKGESFLKYEHQYHNNLISSVALFWNGKISCSIELSVLWHLIVVFFSTK